jgi:hypothetical protein
MLKKRPNKNKCRALLWGLGKKPGGIIKRGNFRLQSTLFAIQYLRFWSMKSAKYHTHGQATRAEESEPLQS